MLFLPGYPSLCTIFMLLILRTAAYRQKDNICPNGLICLTSFVFCGEIQGNAGCDWGQNEFPIHSNQDRNTGYGMIDMYEYYNITWKNANPSYPINLTWHFGFEKTLRWSTALNGSSFRYRPADILNTFSNEFSNHNSLEVKAFCAEMSNTISVSQPESFESGSSTLPEGQLFHASNSNQFAVVNRFARMAIEAQGEISQRKECKKWAQAVGISIGIGVPIIMVLSGLLGRTIAKKRMMQRLKATRP